MLNLILKDILLQKRIIAFIFFYAILFVFAFQGSEIIGLVAVVMGITYTAINTVASIEDKNKADVLLNSLPISRKKLVLAKYISLFVYMIMGILSYIIVTNLIKAFALPIEVFPVTGEALMAAVLGTVLINSIQLPVFFKFGYTKSRIIGLILFISIFFGISAGMNAIGFHQNKVISEFFTNLSDMQITFLMIALAFLILLCSYLLSLKIYQNKEF